VQLFSKHNLQTGDPKKHTKTCIRNHKLLNVQNMNMRTT
jgi:hypothetical protein